MTDRFELVSQFAPAGDQPKAIAALIAGFEAGEAGQTLLGVTGSGKTYTIANVVQAIQRPTIVMAPNAGHFVQFDEPELVNTTIRTWLDARRKK